MKINPKKAALIGVAATTLFTLSACDDSEPASPPAPSVEQNAPDTVYGPPEYFEDETPTPEAEQELITPDQNEIVDVYGPPPE